jgi:hypothetical protein
MRAPARPVFGFMNMVGRPAQVTLHTLYVCFATVDVCANLEVQTLTEIYTKDLPSMMTKNRSATKQ